MKIQNIFTIHKWGRKEFIAVILSFQLSILGIIGLESLGLSFPILRSLIGFLYLTFIPGIVILRNLKLDNISNVESILYTVGLSLATLMFTGFLMNLIYPVLGITKPLSIWPIIFTISAIVVFLSILSYIRDDGFGEKQYLKIENMKIVCFLILIPFLTVIGTCLMNLYNINLLIFILLIIISLLVIIGLNKRFIPSLYPLTIFIISISLLYHNSLISMNIWGFDIFQELYIANKVIQNGYWIANITSDINSMLSIVMIAPIYSLICKLSVEWIYKIIYPFIFSLVPLGIYLIVKRYASSKIAFLSVFYFMAVYMFYCDMLELARQQIAELFFVLLILIIVSSKSDKMKKSLLLVIFGFSLMVSHYGLSYISMYLMLGTAILLYLIYKSPLKDLRAYNMLKRKIIDDNNFKSFLTLNFTLLIVISGISWYMYTSDSSPFVSVLNLFNQMFGSVSNLVDPTYSQGLSIATSKEPFLTQQITKYLFLISQFLVVIGVTTVLSKKTKFGIEYRLLSLFSLSILILALILPYLSSALQTSRLYQIMLLILSPFVVLGSLKLIDILSKITRIKINKNTGLYIISIFLAIFFLFNSGVVYKSVNEIQPSMTLMALDKSFDYPVFSDAETAGAVWLSNFNNNKTINADRYRILLLAGYNGESVSAIVPHNYKNLIPDSLIYLGTFNIKNNQMAVLEYQNSSFGTSDTIDIKNLWDNEDIIYDNDGARVILRD